MQSVEHLLILLLVPFLIWLLVGPVTALVKAAGAQKKAENAISLAEILSARLGKLERELRNLKDDTVIPDPRRTMVPDMVREEAKPVHEVPEWQEDAVPQLDKAVETATPPVMPPPMPPPVPPVPMWSPVQRADQGVLESFDVARETPEHEDNEPFSLERFMGVKIFAWLGGVAMFFGVIFFVKYAFENNLIPPAVRIALGFTAGAGLLVGGLATHRLQKYKVLGQVFCATGVVILYGVSFAAHAIYHFPAFGTLPTFVLMCLITLTAFLLAVRLDALVVAVLGMLGGFLTPVLVSTGQDQVLGLFGYIALLDIGLLAVSRHGRWRFLTISAAVGTALMQMAWSGRFFMAGRYFEGNKILIPMGIAVFFIVLFLACMWLERRKERLQPYAAASVLGLAGLAMLFSFRLLAFQQVAERYFLLYGFIMVVQLAVLAAVVLQPKLGAAQVAAALLVFFHLVAWSQGNLTAYNLGGVLALYLVFGAYHAVVPVVMSRRLQGDMVVISPRIGPWFAPLTVLMMLVPLFHLTSVSMAIWPAVLLLDLLVIGLAAATGALLPVLASLLLTMGVAALWLLKTPVLSEPLMPFLGVVTGFSLVFAAAGKWLTRGIRTEEANLKMNTASVLPVCAGVLPFGMLVLALVQLPVANPAPVFGVALLMAVLLSGLAVLGKQGPLVLAALLCTLVVEAVWHVYHFQADQARAPLAWYLGFYVLFLGFPFVFRKACAGQAAPWVASALSGLGHFLLVHDLVKHAWPNGMMGLVPAAFAVPALLALMVVIRSTPEMDRDQLRRLAWFGGVALLFITLIFPIQFDRQWITVSWALEGALLLWLFRRVPHPGLQLVGLALLTICFVRLALNPAVFTDYPRSGTAILNWHFYAYGIVGAAQIIGAGWFTDPSGMWTKFQPRGVLYAFGGVLLFLLLNIEIADYFTAPGARCVAFDFEGNLPRDMTYSIAWGIFSLGVLLLGIGFKSRHTRYAAIALLVATLVKVFLHDLAASATVFRIGALMGVAVIAFIASFLYQRFFDRSKLP